MLFDKCPECETRPVMTAKLEVDAETYSEILEPQFQRRNGIETAESVFELDELDHSVDPDAAGLKLTYDQDAYKTDNHFEHRTDFEKMPQASVVDYDADGVEMVSGQAAYAIIKFHGRYTHLALSCPSCGHQWDTELGPLNEFDELDPASKGMAAEAEDSRVSGLMSAFDEATTGAMKELFTELTVLDNPDKIPVMIEPGEGSHADSDGEYIQIDPETARGADPQMGIMDQLRVTTDVHYHEMEHIRSSDLESKKEMSKAYPIMPKVAGYVANVLEDQWVDHERMRRKPGMRRNRAFFMSKLAENDEMQPPVNTLEVQQQYVAGLLQQALFGAVKGMGDDGTAEHLSAFIDDVEPWIETVRETREPADRQDIFHRVMLTLVEYLEAEAADEPEPPEMDMGGEGGAGDGEGDEMPSPGSPKDETTLSSDEAGKVDAAVKEAMDKHDIEGDLPRYSETDIDDAEFGDDEIEPGPKPDGRRTRADDGDDGSAGDGDESGAGGDAEPDTDADETGSIGHAGASESRGESRGDEPAPDDTSGGEGLPGSTNEHATSGRVSDAIPDTYDIDRDDDLSEPSSSDERMLDRFQRKREKFEQDIEQKRRERDDRIVEKRQKSRKYSYDKSEDFRAEMRDQVEAVVNKFKELQSRETPEPERHGERVHRRNAVRRASGDRSEERVFTTPEQNDTGQRTVAVTADISGSMGGDIANVKKTMGAIGEATREVEDTYVATGITDDPDFHSKAKREGPDVITEEALDLRLVTGPDEAFDWKQLDSFSAESNEPIAAGMRWTKDLMSRVESTQEVMFVITDGQALITEDGRNKPTQAKRDVEQAATEFREDGMEVIGIGFGGAHASYMEDCFGEENYVMTTPDSLAEDVIEMYVERVKQ